VKRPVGRVRALVAVVAGTVALSVTAARVAGSSVGFNTTASLPIGFYLRHRDWAARRGELVSVVPPPALASLVAAGDLPAGASLLKRIVAVPGDRVCTINGFFEAAGAVVGPIFQVDRHGHALPQHSVCDLVPPGHLYLGAPHPRSIDSRYFGAVNFDAIEYRWSPMWTF
jgi:conjugative transfer signal peptidase TraF